MNNSEPEPDAQNLYSAVLALDLRDEETVLIVKPDGGEVPGKIRISEGGIPAVVVTDDGTLGDLGVRTMDDSLELAGVGDVVLDPLTEVRV